MEKIQAQTILTSVKREKTKYMYMYVLARHYSATRHLKLKAGKKTSKANTISARCQRAEDKKFVKAKTG